jgi:hypothetical protein
MDRQGDDGMDVRIIIDGPDLSTRFNLHQV